MNTKTDNLNIRAVHVLLSPAALAEVLLLEDESSEFALIGRRFNGWLRSWQQRLKQGCRRQNMKLNK